MCEVLISDDANTGQVACILYGVRHATARIAALRVPALHSRVLLLLLIF
jgi:hypothetical protein